MTWSLSGFRHLAPAAVVLVLLAAPAGAAGPSRPAIKPLACPGVVDQSRTCGLVVRLASVRLARYRVAVAAQLVEYVSCQGGCDITLVQRAVVRLVSRRGAVVERHVFSTPVATVRNGASLAKMSISANLGRWGHLGLTVRATAPERSGAIPRSCRSPGGFGAEDRTTRPGLARFTLRLTPRRRMFPAGSLTRRRVRATLSDEIVNASTTPYCDVSSDPWAPVRGAYSVAAGWRGRSGATTASAASAGHDRSREALTQVFGVGWPYKPTYARTIEVTAPRGAFSYGPRLAWARLRGARHGLTGTLRFHATSPALRPNGIDPYTAAGAAARQARFVGRLTAHFRSGPVARFAKRAGLAPCGGFRQAAITACLRGPAEKVLEPCPAGVAPDGHGGVYALASGGDAVCPRPRDRIVHFAADGRVLARWAAPAIGVSLSNSGIRSDPRSIAVSRDGHVLVGDTALRRIEIFDAHGALRSTIPLPYGSIGLGPQTVAVDPDGSLVVLLDSPVVGDAWVERLASDGHVLARWGPQGNADGHLFNPVALALAPDRDVYVAEGRLYRANRGTRRIQEFGPGGTFLARFGDPGTAPGRLSAPSGIAVGPNGDVYVADAGNSRIAEFTAGGRLARTWGRSGSGPGEFRLAGPNPNHEERAGVAVDSAGHVYVADRRNGRIQKFTADGRWLASWQWPY